MNLLIDFGAIKTGGGAQLAINFLEYLKINRVEKLFLILPEQGVLSEFKPDFAEDCIFCPSHYIKRKIWEIFKLRDYIIGNSIDCCFTFFGSGLPKYKKEKSLVSVAYPIICYPDSEFWAVIPKRYRYRIKFINFFRKNRIRNADMVLAETEVMAMRLQYHVGVERHKIRVIAPVPTSYVADQPFRDIIDRHCPVFLFLSGLDFHKNLWRLPRMASFLSCKGLDKFIFKVSVTKDEYLSRYKFDLDDRIIIDKYFHFIGQIHPASINTIYNQSDFMVNISYLESFSNNYMEAWKSSLPIISLDTDFSRHICGDSALYIQFDELEESAREIVELVDNDSRRKMMICEGKKRLLRLPTLPQRAESILSILENMHHDS